MDALTYSDLLRQTTFAVGTPPTYSFIETWRFEDATSDASSDVVREGTLAPGNIEDWLLQRRDFAPPVRDGEGKPLGGVRLIITEDADLWTSTYPFKYPTFLSIVLALKIPLFLLRASRNVPGTCMKSIVRDGADDSASRIDMVIKVPQANSGKNPVGTYCLALSHDMSTGITSGLLMGEWTGHFTRLISRIRATVPLATHPLLLPTLLYDDYVWRTGHRAFALDEEITGIEKRIGVVFTGRLQHAKTTNEKERDYAALTADVHSCLTSLIFLEAQTCFQQRFTAFLVSSDDDIQPLVPPNRRRDFVIGARKLREWIDLSRDEAAGFKESALSVQKRAQTQAQVLYSLLAQRDSKLNASIAMDSKRVASASKRDSSAMKTIASLTMLFLPGTYIAAIFSTSMFNFHASDGSSPDQKPTVSKYIWVYWVLTIGLTVVVVALWLVWMRRSERRHKAEDQAAEEELRSDKYDR